MQKFLRLRRAQNFLSVSRLGPGSSPGRAESQLASELGELPLLGPQRAAVQQLPWPTATATATATGNAAGEQQPAGAAGRRSEHQRRSVAATAAAAEEDASASVPPPRASVVMVCGVGCVCVLAAAERVEGARSTISRVTVPCREVAETYF